MATLSNNTTLRVNRAITGATTVNPNCYAQVNYIPTAPGLGTPPSDNVVSVFLPPIMRIFGPGQAIPSSFTVDGRYSYSGAPNTAATFTYSLSGGVEFINTP